MGCLLPYINRVVPCKVWCGWVGWKAAGLPGLVLLPEPCRGRAAVPKAAAEAMGKGLEVAEHLDPIPSIVTRSWCGLLLLLPHCPLL